MASVFRAVSVSREGLRRSVAIKYIHESLADVPDFEAQFRAEARLLALLQHPNTVQVLDFDRDAAGRLFLVMELVEGTDLRRVRDQGPLPVELAVYVAAEVLRGLAYAHAATDEQGRALGLVHRDLSPQNVLVSWGGAVKITDFGIARCIGGATTRTGVIKGNAGYMSPEQIEGRVVDGRTDLYAVGVLLYELLVGAPLYAHPDRPTRSILAQVLLSQPAPLAEVRGDVPEALSEFALALLAREPESRPATAELALRQLLELDLLPATAGLDFARYLEAVRRACERPTLLDEEAPDDLRMPSPAAPMSAPLDLDTQSSIVPIEGIQVRRSRSWLPLLTVALAVAVVVLSGLLLRPQDHKNYAAAVYSAPKLNTAHPTFRVHRFTPPKLDTSPAPSPPSRRRRMSARSPSASSPARRPLPSTPAAAPPKRPDPEGLLPYSPP